MRIRMLRDGGHRLPLMARFLQGEAENDRRRREENPIRKLYSTARWGALRWSALVADDFTCRMCGWSHPLANDCRALKALGRVEVLHRRPVPELVADHVTPHRGDESRFWDPQNLQCLCQGCHSGAKQRAEQASRRGRPGGVG